jgi:hypothetical protein
MSYPEIKSDTQSNKRRMLHYEKHVSVLIMIIGARDHIEIVCQAGRKVNQQTDVAGRMITGLYRLLSALGLYLRHQATTHPGISRLGTVVGASVLPRFS